MSFWKFAKADTEVGSIDELYIDGEIVAAEDWWQDGVIVAKDFRHQLSMLGDVVVKINSIGGSVFAASEMYAALRDHPGKVTVQVTGIAASAASVVAMAGDEVQIHPTAYMMIHDPWTVVSGNAQQLKHEARVLQEIGEGIINAYCIKTGRSHDEIARMMAAETTMSAATCVELGFADSIIGAELGGKAVAMMTDRTADARAMDAWREHQPHDAADNTDTAADRARIDMRRRAILSALYTNR